MTSASFAFLSLTLSVLLQECSLDIIPVTALQDADSTTTVDWMQPFLPANEDEEEVTVKNQYTPDGTNSESTSDDGESNNLFVDDETPNHSTDDGVGNFGDSGCAMVVGCSNGDDIRTSARETDATISMTLPTVTVPSHAAVNGETRETNVSNQSSSVPEVSIPNTTVSISSLDNVISFDSSVRKDNAGDSAFHSRPEFKGPVSVSPLIVKDTIEESHSPKDVTTDINNNIFLGPLSTKAIAETSVTFENHERISTISPAGEKGVEEKRKPERKSSSASGFSETITTPSANISEPQTNGTEHISPTNILNVTYFFSSENNSYEEAQNVTTSTVPFEGTDQFSTLSGRTSSSSTTSMPGATHPIQPKLTNPSCAMLPVCVRVRAVSHPPLCDGSEENLTRLGELVREYLARYVYRSVVQDQIVFELSPCSDPDTSASSTAVLFFVTDSSGEYEENLTVFAGFLMRKNVKKLPTANNSLQVIAVEMTGSEEEDVGLNVPSLATPHSGIIAAVAISVVAGACLCLLCVLLLVMKQRLASQQRRRPPEVSALDNYSLDSFAINASFRRRLHSELNSSSFLNYAFANDEDDTTLPSKPLSLSDLANLLYHHRNHLIQEFEKLPMNMHKLDKVPVGAEVKNRYANVVPNPKTRVLLTDKSDDPVTSYINANYVKSHSGNPRFYIACQSPLTEYVADFWRMVWEQQSRLILMLTMLEENGISRCAAYFPENTLDFRQLHGNYEVSLVKKDVREFYTASTFRVLDVQKNLFREVLHLWYKAWPPVGVPNDPSNLVTFLLQARPFINCNSGPTIVHCSAGTGRTGVLIALDICMRQYEESRSVDVLRCVSKIRLDRGGTVQNKDQYILIHEALMEYASRSANQSNRPSIQSNQ